MNDNINPEIRAFLEEMLSAKKIKADGELKEIMVSELYQRLQLRFMQIITKHLNARDLKTLDEIALTGEDKVQSFLLSRIKNLNQLFKQAMLEFREAYLKG